MANQVVDVPAAGKRILDEIRCLRKTLLRSIGVALDGRSGKVPCR
jgi:hypothetical protein